MDLEGGSLSGADQKVGGLGTLTDGSAAGSFGTAYQTTVTVKHSLTAILLLQVMVPMQQEL